MNKIYIFVALALVLGISVTATTAFAAGPSASTRCTNNLSQHVAADSRQGPVAQSYISSGLCGSTG